MVLKANSLFLSSPAIERQPIRKAEEIFLKTWLAEHEFDENARLFHYTNLDGLRGIISDRALWFSHIRTLNDPLEIEYGIRILADEINASIEDESGEDARAFLRKLLQNVKGITTKVHDVFVACFCQSGNLLSQWRTYADKGGGYCLGFQFSERTELAPAGGSHDQRKLIFLRRVIYCERTQRALVQKYLNSVIQAAKIVFRDELGSVSEDDRAGVHAQIMAMQASNILLDMVFCFKHNAFEEELEWRLVRATMTGHEPEGVKFRAAGPELVPYRSMQLFDVEENDALDFPLRAINFGPSLDPERTRSGIDLYMRHVAADRHPIAIQRDRVAVN